MSGETHTSAAADWIWLRNRLSSTRLSSELCGISFTLVDLERTFSIAPAELKIGFTLLHEWLAGSKLPALIHHPGRIDTQVRAVSTNRLPFVELTSGILENIELVYQRYSTRDQGLVNIERHLQELSELDALPVDSPMLFLGYFAILESLLTHKPKKTDTIDSITRQVKQKVMLLDNRWQPRLDYSALQGTPEVIWKKMYHYRSDIAHGAELDFKNNLHQLGDNKRALKLLKDTVRSVLCQIIIEPQLMLDIRNC